MYVAVIEEQVDGHQVKGHMQRTPWDIIIGLWLDLMTRRRGNPWGIDCSRWRVVTL